MSILQTRKRFNNIFNSPLYKTIQPGKDKDIQRIKMLDFSSSERESDFMPPDVIYTSKETLIKDNYDNDTIFNRTEFLKKEHIPLDVPSSIIPGLLLLDKQFRNPEDFTTQVFLVNLGVLLLNQSNVDQTSSNNKFYKEFEKFWHDNPEVQFIIEKDIPGIDVTNREQFRKLRANLIKWFHSERVIKNFVNTVVPEGIQKGLILNKYKSKVEYATGLDLGEKLPTELDNASTLKLSNKYNMSSRREENLKKFSQTLPFNMPIQTPTELSTIGYYNEQTGSYYKTIDARGNIIPVDELLDNDFINKLLELKKLVLEKFIDKDKYTESLFSGIQNKFDEIYYDETSDTSLDDFLNKLDDIIEKYIKDYTNENDEEFIKYIKLVLQENDMYKPPLYEYKPKSKSKSKKQISTPVRINDNYKNDLNRLLSDNNLIQYMYDTEKTKIPHEIGLTRTMLMYILRQKRDEINDYINILKRDGQDEFHKYFIANNIGVVGENGDVVIMAQKKIKKSSKKNKSLNKKKKKSKSPSKKKSKSKSKRSKSRSKKTHSKKRKKTHSKRNVK